MADNKTADTVWFVRGVAITLRADVAEAAKREGMRIGPWVERALRTAIAGSGIAATDPMADLTRRLQAVETRLAKLERGGSSDGRGWRGGGGRAGGHRGGEAAAAPAMVG